MTAALALVAPHPTVEQASGITVRNLRTHRTELDPPPLRLVRPPDDDCPDRPQTPDRAAVHRLVSAVLEVVAGRRPIAHLDALVAKSDRGVLLQLGPQQWTPLSMHTQYLATPAVEITTTIRRTGHSRVRALAARLEPTDPTTWHFTRFTLI